FCEIKGIKTEFSVPRTPQQNGIAERKNRTLIEAARTMLADSLLPIPFWAEAVNTACYVQNRVFMTKPQDKTPYELLNGRTPREEIVQQYVLFPIWFSSSTNPQNTDGYAAFDEKELEFDEKKPESEVNVSPSSSARSKKHDDKTKREAKGKSHVESLTGYRNLSSEFEDFSDNSINEVNAVDTLVPAVGQLSPNNTNTFSATELEDITYSDDEDNVGAEADFNNLETSITVSPIPTTSVYKDHHVTQIIGDLSSTTQTRSMTRVAKDQGGLSQINNDDFHTCMFACFLLQEEPKRVHQAIKDLSWIEAMHKELLQFKMQKKEGIDYKEVFALVARIEAIRLFLAYTYFMGFMVYQMDVKSAFLYGTIKEEVYVCQPLGFEDPDYPDKMKDGIFISHDKYVADILRKFGLTARKSASTLIDTEKPLLKDLDVKRIFRYLKGKPHLGLWYPKDSPFNLVAYSNSDYAGASLDRKSTTEGCQFLRCRLISWQCKKQTVVSTSSTEAKYVAAASCCAQVLWIHNQLLDYGPDQTVSGKDSSNPLMADNLPKIIWYSTHHVALMKSWLVQKKTALGVSTPRCDEDRLELMELTVFLLSSDEKVRIEVCVVDLQVSAVRLILLLLVQKFLMFDKKKVVITEASIRDALCLDDTEVEQLVGKSADEGVPTAGVAAESVVSATNDVVPTVAEETSIPSLTPPTPPPQPSQDQPSTSQKLERRNKASKLKRLKRVGTAQRIDTSDANVLDDVSKQGRMIDDMDADVDVTLKDVVAKDVHDAIKLAELQEVVEVVTTAKLITEVVNAASATINVATLQLTTAAAPTLTTSPTKSKDKGKGILVEEPKPLKKQALIEQDEAYARKIEAELNKNIDCDKVIDHVQRKQKEDNAMKRYPALKRKPQTEAQAIKNMMIYLRNTKDQMDDEDSRALKRLSETQEEKAAEKQKLGEEVEELRRHLHIVPNDEDDVYTEATPLARKVPVVDYEIYTENNKPYYKIKRADGSHQLYLSFLSMLRNFDREDLEVLWQLVKGTFMAIGNWWGGSRSGGDGARLEVVGRQPPVV
nr:hypothetical protein [Tanacetum cinerariifolium]